MFSAPALHLKPWTDQRRTLALESTGRKPGQTAGTHVSDLAALKKTILLCSSCRPKFDDKAYGYVTSARLPMCGGKCDGCKDNGMGRSVFLHHSQMPR